MNEMDFNGLSLPAVLYLPIPLGRMQDEIV